MALKHYKPTTPGQRQLVLVDRSHLYKGKPEKGLTVGLRATGGRNNRGKVTAYHKGGGHKRAYRLVDFKRQKFDMPAKVERLEYDPNRSAFIALLRYSDGTLSYILAPQRVKVGDEVVSGAKVDVKPGNAMPLKAIPTGTTIHNIEMHPGKRGQMVRGAGVAATLVAKMGQYCQVKLPSGEVRQVLSECRATIGQVGNTDNENIKIGKAGRNRWKGKRPKVRGMAMNPIDHPLGGGEGVGKGHHPVTPWGKPCKGYKTRKNKRTDGMIIKRRNKK